MIIKIALVGLAFCAGFGSAQPSAAEFNLFCRILAEANNMMYGPEYVYDENVDKEIIKEMTVLYNATTSNMNEFRKTLWDTKDFFEEHPPPTQPESRKKAHREIGNLIKEGEEKIQENKKIALEVNKKINEAKLSVAKGIFGEHVNEVPKQDGNLTKILNDTGSIFNDNNSAKRSCGYNGNETGKTLLNDFFCVCVGDGLKESAGACSPYILPPKNTNDSNNGGWKAIKLKGAETTPIHFNESFKHIEKVCTEELMGGAKPTKDIPALLEEYVGLIDLGPAKTNKSKKIFGHSGRSTNHGYNKVENCTGEGVGNGFGKEAANANFCVDYTKYQNKDGKTYNITWHNKFTEAFEKLQNAKKIEDQILKKRAALVLLKNQAWAAYSREKDDETSNLDDMNASDKKDTMAENKQGEPTNQEREYIDVPSQSTQGSQPSQPAPGNADGRKYHYISSTESTQEEAPAAPAGGGEPPYIYVSSTGTPSQPTPAPETPSPTQQDPPTQSAKRLRDENKTGE